MDNTYKLISELGKKKKIIERMSQNFLFLLLSILSLNQAWFYGCTLQTKSHIKRCDEEEWWEPYYKYIEENYLSYFLSMQETLRYLLTIVALNAWYKPKMYLEQVLQHPSFLKIINRPEKIWQKW